MAGSLLAEILSQALKSMPETREEVVVSPSGRSALYLGYLVMAVLVGFVAAWMRYQAGIVNSGSNESKLLGDSIPESLEGFDPNLFFLPNDGSAGFVVIPGGSFTMGSNPAFDRMAYENERWSLQQRQGIVVLPSYMIGRFEVATIQYLLFAKDTGLDVDPRILDLSPDAPVSYITWTEAIAYCEWLQAKLSESELTPSEIKHRIDSGWKVSLPNEAQWEKAARGSDGRVFPWGNSLRADRANFNSRGTVRVGSIPCPECSYGISDMSGNVWEFTSSVMSRYPFTSDYSNLDVAADALWVMRGGSFSDGEANIRAAVRGGVDPGVRSGTIGFRLAILPPSLSEEDPPK